MKIIFLHILKKFYLQRTLYLEISSFWRIWLGLCILSVHDLVNLLTHFSLHALFSIGIVILGIVLFTHFSLYALFYLRIVLFTHCSQQLTIAALDYRDRPCPWPGFGTRMKQENVKRYFRVFSIKKWQTTTKT